MSSSTQRTHIRAVRRRQTIHADGLQRKRHTTQHHNSPLPLQRQDIKGRQVPNNTAKTLKASLGKEPLIHVKMVKYDLSTERRTTKVHLKEKAKSYFRRTDEQTSLGTPIWITQRTEVRWGRSLESKKSSHYKRRARRLLLGTQSGWRKRPKRKR